VMVVLGGTGEVDLNGPFSLTTNIQ
jgi:hypothetical protein